MPHDIETNLLQACSSFWKTYYAAILQSHQSAGRTAIEPVRDRNLITTDSKHISCFEKFWRVELAAALGVPEAEVGPRVVKFRPHRKKSFDVCWPLTGTPRILISVKSMQNAYRNLTNRIEEAIGDSAVLRLYNSTAVFGFFFFILNGNVASGEAEQGVSLRTTGAKGVAPYLALIEDGGDFFDLADIERYKRPSPARIKKIARKRQHVIDNAALSLLDLVAEKPAKAPTIHYDAIAFTPTKIKQLPGTDDYQMTVADVDERLDFRTFIPRLLAVARLRGFIK